MKTITLNIADILTTLDLADCDPSMQARIVQRYEAFTVPPSPALVTIRLRTEPGRDYLPVTPGETWQIHTHRRGEYVDFESYFEKGWVDFAAGQGELVMRPQGNPENFLRVLYAWLGIDRHMLLLHASGIISNGRGFVFYGHSGSGKTTVTTFSLDRTVLSDDIVIVKKVDGVYRVFGVPFRGDMPEAPRTNASAPVVGLSILVKDQEHFLAPLETPLAVARLASCVPFVMNQPETAERVTQICADLVAHVPPRALHFRRDPGFWRLLDGLE